MEKKIRINILLPLLGVTVAWVATVLAAYLDLGINQYYNSASFVEVRPSTYVVLAGLVLGSVLALWGFKRADAAHAIDEKTPLIRAEYRFTALLIILGMVFLAIFAISTFMGSFTSYYPAPGPTVFGRIFGVYLPIVLAAGAVVFVLLQATLYRKTSPVEGTEDKGLSATQKALAIGYAVPIIGTALAIIIGLVVYDTQNQRLETWAWVVIQLIIGGSIYLGTRSAAKARSAKPVVKPPRVAGAAGAVTLNYVLSLVFAGTVSIMSFSFASAAISKLVFYPNCGDGSVSCDAEILDVTLQWWFNEMIPAFLLLVLVQVAIYLVIVTRNKPITSS
jgi:MFS family permease